jgi:hypothetical protein
MNDWITKWEEMQSTLQAMRDCLKDREHIIEQLIADNVELMEANKYLSNKLTDIIWRGR